LLAVATHAIEHGLQHHKPLICCLENYPPSLQVQRATFVTLHHRGALRGCIGTIEAKRPLIADVAHQAYAAAFADPRFSPLSAGELDGLAIHISVLTPPEPLAYNSESGLIAQLRPHVDGIVLEEGWRRATFLPAVWDSLPDPEEFLRQLKIKAGLGPAHWSGRVRVYRYTAESIP
jgi:uncharacterized protein